MQVTSTLDTLTKDEWHESIALWLRDCGIKKSMLSRGIRDKFIPSRPYIAALEGTIERPVSMRSCERVSSLPILIEDPVQYQPTKTCVYLLWVSKGEKQSGENREKRRWERSGQSQSESEFRRKNSCSQLLHLLWVQFHLQWSVFLICSFFSFVSRFHLSHNKENEQVYLWGLPARSFCLLCSALHPPPRFHSFFLFVFARHFLFILFVLFRLRLHRLLPPPRLRHHPRRPHQHRHHPILVILLLSWWCTCLSGRISWSHSAGTREV